MRACARSPSASTPTSPATAGSRSSRARSRAHIAYFSPEFGVDGSLPQYSGGLGILAGDHLKSSSDLGVPLTGVGLFYRAGYFRQSIGDDGWQRESYPLLDPYGLGLTLLRDERRLPRRDHARPAARPVPARPRVGGRHRPHPAAAARLRDALEHRGDAPRHRPPVRRRRRAPPAAGAAARRRRRARGARVHARSPAARRPTSTTRTRATPGSRASSGCRSSSPTTASTSTRPSRRCGHPPSSRPTRPCPPASTASRATSSPTTSRADCSRASTPPRALALGLEDYDGGDHSVFNMAVLGLHLGQHANGVSLLHGAVSRGMFGQLWPGIDTDEVPITSITNGVHAPTWVHPALKARQRARVRRRAHRRARLAGCRRPCRTRSSGASARR